MKQTPQVLVTGARALAGWPGLVVVAAVLTAYVALALAPFRWAPPRRVANAAAVDASGLRFPAPGLARTPSPPAWLEAAAATNRIRVDLRVRTHAPWQEGPAAIFTVSRDLHLANLTLCQEGGDLVLRLRRPGSTPNGKPAHTLAEVFTDTAWRDVALDIEPGRLRLAVDGRLVLDRPLPANALAGWSHGHRLSLGNELNGRRPWRGEIAAAVVDVEGVPIDYARPGALEIAPTFWAVPNPPQWFPEEREEVAVGDWVANFVSFALLGFLLGARGGAWLPAVLLCSLSSLGVEIAQLFFSRHLELTDWLLNTLGGAAGVATARRLRRSPGRGGSGRAPVSAAPATKGWQS